MVHRCPGVPCRGAASPCPARSRRRGTTLRRPGFRDPAGARRDVEVARMQGSHSPRSPSDRRAWAPGHQAGATVKRPRSRGRIGGDDPPFHAPHVPGSCELHGGEGPRVPAAGRRHGLVTTLVPRSIDGLARERSSAPGDRWASKPCGPGPCGPRSLRDIAGREPWSRMSLMGLGRDGPCRRGFNVSMCRIDPSSLMTSPWMRLGNAVSGDVGVKIPSHLPRLGARVPCSPSAKVPGQLAASGP